MCHCNRMERALRLIRVPVKHAMAHYFFLKKRWIRKTIIKTNLSSKHADVNSIINKIFCSDDDVMRTVNEYEFSGINSQQLSTFNTNASLKT